MSDKTEAELLGKVFKILGEQINRDRRNIADEIWELVLSNEINPQQMKCDSVLEDMEILDKCENCGREQYRDLDHDCE
jgi:hypothetical protein